MKQIELSIRLRPIRFAFLIRPGDSANLQKALEINTCLWGGMYNPIIPFFERVPKWWNKGKKSFYNAREIIDFHLDFFEPDFVVEAEKDLSKNLGIKKDRILQLNDLIMPSTKLKGYNLYGLNVFELYEYLYKKEFKFARRHKNKIVNITSGDGKYTLFCSRLFGKFMHGKDIDYIGAAFKDAFEPDEIKLDSKSFKNLYNNYYVSPLIIGSEQIEIRHFSERNPILFLLDAFNPRDLIDFWNFRILKPDVLAIPLQWIEQLSDFCKDFISRNYRPLPHNPHGIMSSTDIQMPRSITEEQGNKIFNNFLKTDNKDAAMISSLYPSFWAPSTGNWPRYSRPSLSSNSKKINVDISEFDKSIFFESLGVNFQGNIINRVKIANVINIYDRFYTQNVATVFPNNLKYSRFPRLGVTTKVETSTGGFVIFPEYKNSSEYWNLIDGTSAIIEWFEIKNIKSKISNPGKIALQLIDSLGGLFGAGVIAHPEIVKLLNEMAHGQVTFTSKSGENTPKFYPGKTITYSELDRRIHEINSSKRINRFSIEKLISKNIIRLGMEVKCDFCNQWNWYSIDETKYKLKCERCLKNYDFPVERPDTRKIRWSYRAIGPFTNPDYALGAYSTAFCFRLFANLLRMGYGNLTWSTSLDIEIKKGKKFEIDYAIWYQSELFNKKPKLLIGEAKSFSDDSFLKKDVERLKTLANHINGSVFVFSTMKNFLSEDEKNAIRPFALWGREHTGGIEPRALVIVLTGTELFFRYSIEEEWKSIGGRHAALIAPPSIRLQNLETLADLTQQLYLNLPSFDDWWIEKIRKKRTSRKKKEGIS